MAVAYIRMIPETNGTSLLSFSRRFEALPDNAEFLHDLTEAAGQWQSAGLLPPHRLSADGISPLGMSHEEYEAMDYDQRPNRSRLIVGIETLRIMHNPIPEEICRKIGSAVLLAKENGGYDLYHNDGYLVNHTSDPVHTHSL